MIGSKARGASPSSAAPYSSRAALFARLVTCAAVQSSSPAKSESFDARDLLRAACGGEQSRARTEPMSPIHSPAIAARSVPCTVRTSGEKKSRRRTERARSMMYRSIVVVAVLVVGACSKSDPPAVTTTSAPAPASPTTTEVSTGGAPSQAPANPAVGDDHAGHMAGMQPGMSMHVHDGGMGHPMPDHSMSGHSMSDHSMPGHE